MKIMTPASIYFSTLIARSPKSLGAIAQELGYTKSNILSMFKKGKTKIPLAMVGPIAVALDGDPVHLFKLVLKEHYPDTYEQILDILGPMRGLTRGELGLINLYRNATGDRKIDLDNPGVAQSFEDHFRMLAAHQEASDLAARERYDRLPHNGKHKD